MVERNGIMHTLIFCVRQGNIRRLGAGYGWVVEAKTLRTRMWTDAFTAARTARAEGQEIKRANNKATYRQSLLAANIRSQLT